MDFIRTIHGELRWLVLIVAAVILVKFAIGWLGRREYKSLDRTLLTIYTIVLDINAVLGLILIFSLGIGISYRIEHAVTMILAVIAAHMTVIWRRSTDSTLKYRNQFLMILLSLALVLMGIVRIRSVLYQAGLF